MQLSKSKYVVSAILYSSPKIVTNPVESFSGSLDVLPDSAELDELLELLLSSAEELLEISEELLETSVDVLVELLDCTEDELESSPHAVSDKTIAAVKTAPKIFCPFFILLPFPL